MAYITNYNMKRIFKELQHSEKTTYTSSNEVIYPEHDDFCQKFFNKMEKSELYAFKQFVSNPNGYIAKRLNFVNTDDSMFLNVDGKCPAYHDDPECERLNSDFTGLMIPDAIRAKGKEVIVKFKKFFKENEALYDTNPDAFEMRASIVFHVKIKIEEVTKKNSGVYEFDNQCAKKVIDEINGLWNSLNNWINEPGKNRMRKSILLSFGTRTFLATPYNILKPIQFNNTGYDDDVIKKELKVLHYEYKLPLIDLIKDFYTAQFNPNMQFDKHLLKELGFVPCQTCA